MADAEFKYNPRVHMILAMLVLIIDVALTTSIILSNKLNYVEPPKNGDTDPSALIGWLSVFGGIFIFGCYGVLIKTPAVEAANTDCMVFQCYYSAAVAITSFVIWLLAGSTDGLTFTGSSFAMGILFGFLWISSQALGFQAIQALGYAVAPAIWIGVTITVSFIWGTAVFNNPVKNWFGAIAAIILLLIGVFIAAMSSLISDAYKKDLKEQEQSARQLTAVNGERLMNSDSTSADGSSKKGSNLVIGVLCASALGLCNGSLMVPMTWFQKGNASLGVEAYIGDALAPLAFLPSLAAGIVVAQPVLFFLYWGRSMAQGVMPQFHFKQVGIYGLLTGVFWAMGNFSAMFATIYLGQTVGFPLTQCCLIINGFWGILYYKEIVGAKAILTFVLASVIIIVGAGMDGIFA